MHKRQRLYIEYSVLQNNQSHRVAMHGFEKTFGVQMYKVLGEPFEKSNL